MAEMQQQQDPDQPWGRFKLVSKDPAEESDHMYFVQKVHKIGRNPQRCDTVIDELFISSVHCVIRLEGKDEAGKAIVKLTDKSRNGVYVNENRVGKGNSTFLESSFTVHFTKPGMKSKGIPPKVYKFELLTNERHSQSEARDVAMDDKPSALIDSGDASPEPTQQSIPMEEGSSPRTKKRKRTSQDEPANGGQGAEVIKSELEAVKAHNAQLQTEMADTMAAAKTVFEQQETELLNVMKKVEAENRELTAKLVEKDKELAARLKKAAEEHKRSLETELQTKVKEMNAKVKEVTMQTQQKLETEHFQQRREMSEKMAAFANESTKLQQELGRKQAELSECEQKLAESKEQLNKAKEETEELIALLTEADGKVASAEQKAFVAEQKVAAAEERATASEEKAAAAEQKAEIIIKSFSNGTSESSAEEREEMKESLASLQTELKEIRSWNVSLVEEVKKQREAGATVFAPSRTTQSTFDVSKPNATANSRPPSDDSEAVLRMRLATAASLFKQIQELSASGLNGVTDVNTSGLEDLHLLSSASVQSIQGQSRTATAGSSGSVVACPSAVGPATDSASSPNVAHDAQDKAEADDGHDPFAEEDKEAIKAEQDGVVAHDALKDKADVMTAEPKVAVLKDAARSPKKSKKQAAPLSAVIETDAASTIASMASANNTEENQSPSDGITVIIDDNSSGDHSKGSSKNGSDNGDGDSGGNGEEDWEMLE